MRAAVTGGAGFVGAALCGRLLDCGWEVALIDDLSGGRSRLDGLTGQGVLVFEYDIRSPQAARAIADFGPTHVFHLAAQIDVRRSVADAGHDASVNIGGSISMIEASTKVGARFINTSSGGCIYGEPSPDSLPVKESSLGRPDSPYGISKKVVEDYLRFFARTMNLDFVNIAPANIYGPGQDLSGEAGVVGIFIGALTAGKPCTIYGDGSQTRDYVFVDDVVDAFVKAASAGSGETLNISSGVETSVLQLHELISGITGVAIEPVFAPARAGEIGRIALDPGAAERVLGWRPTTTLREGVERTCLYISQQK